MSAPAEPLRLLLLADTPDWAPLLGERLRALGPAFSLSIVTTWEGAATLFAAEPRGLLLATPACLPLGTPCPWPVILLLQQEPAQAPVGVVDWLAAEQLSEDSRRCLRYARERLGLQATLQLLAEQDPLTGIANRQGFQTLLAARLSEFDGVAWCSATSTWTTSVTSTIPRPPGRRPPDPAGGQPPARLHGER